jgi:predicted transcriptional regulator
MIRPGKTRTFTISFPPDLAEQVERLAKRESRTTSELFREAFRMYRAQRLRAIMDRANAGVREGGFPRYGTEDVEGLVQKDRDTTWAKQEKEADERIASSLLRR